MIGTAVIALPIVLHRELPVALLHEIILVGDLAVANIVRANMRLHRLAHDRKVLRRGIGEANKDETGEAFDMDRFEAELAAVKILSHVLVIDELAAAVIGPLMIRADEPGERAAARIAQARPAMPANVMKGAKRRVSVTNDDDRIGTQLDRKELSGLRDLRIHADENPVAAEDARDVRVEDLWAQVKRCRKRVTGPAACDQTLKDVAIHGWDLSIRARLHRGSAPHSQ